MLTALRRHIAARLDQPHDSGISLIELTVSMVVSLIVLGAATTFFINIVNTSSATTVITTNADQARITLDSWAGLFAVADSPTTPGSASGRISSLTATNAVFYANIGNRTGTSARTAPTQISLSIANGQLVEARTLNNVTTTRYLAGCLTTSTGSTSGCVTAGRVSASSIGFVPYSSCATGLCPMTYPVTDLGSVSGVSISFTMIDPHGGAGQTYSTIAALPQVSA